MLKNGYPTNDIDNLSQNIKHYTLLDKNKPLVNHVKPSQLTLPLSATTTLRHFKELLTAHEQSEILSFREIYFAGAAHVLKIGSDSRKSGADLANKVNICKLDEKEDINTLYNDGYDDSRGDYYLTKHDHIGYRYEILSLLGKGSFGQVVKCFDHKKRVNVAVKLIRNKKRFEKQGMVEVSILSHLKDQDPNDEHCIIHIQDHFYFRNHLCITFELLGINLYEWIKAGGFKGVHLGICKIFAQQMLKSLNLLSKSKIIHCDLKPEVCFGFYKRFLYKKNILLKQVNNTQPHRNESNFYPLDSSKCLIPTDFDIFSTRYQIKVIDFGSSCYENERIYTYVQSRFYRSPEIILGIPYSESIDMWSLGCILAELYSGYPLFPGENESDQLACIMEIFGLPNSELIGRGSRKRHFFDSSGNPRSSSNSKAKKRRPNTKSLLTCLGSCDASFVDFIRHCLEWDPLLRMTPAEALRHPWTANTNESGSSRMSDRSSKEKGLLPRVKGNQISSHPREGIYTSKGSLGGYNNSLKAYPSLKNLPQTSTTRLKPPLLDRLRNVDISKVHLKKPGNTGLPPISFSQPNLQKKYSTATSSSSHLSLGGGGDRLMSIRKGVSMDVITSSPSSAREIPPWRI